jgi:predicted aconitase with swiveling domain
MAKLGTAPAAIINEETEAILATGCVISNIPLVDKLDQDPMKVIKNGMRVRVNADEGTVEILD